MRRSDDQVSLLDVSVRRLPIYLWIVLGVVVLGMVLSVVSTVRQETGWCLESLLYFLSTMAEFLNGYVAASILACGAIEGFIVGLAELRRKQSVRQAREQALEEGRQEGRQEGMERAIEVLERSGNVDAARALRERNEHDKR
ncbi:MAG: hypothetical protein OXC12_06835 [Spirochaetaceae bacterium]|nr:hypothetical protein [Spirochaetaceae bacterium]